MLKYVALAFLLGVAIQVVEPPAYPEGVSCSPDGTMAGGKVIDASPDHKCSCKRMDADPLCEGTVQEDAACLQFCSRGHCSCKVICASESHH